MDTQLKQSVFTCIEHEARQAGIYLPSGIIQLCIRMIGLNSFVWHIDDPTLIKQILSAKCRDKFRSDAFQIGKLNWAIRLYPTGFDDKTKGFCGVYAKLLGMPSSWKSIFCQLHIECPQIQNKMMASASYNEPKSRGQLISSFEGFKASCHKDITFIITIRIARITLKEDNKILFQIPTNEYKTKTQITQLQWKIDQEMMEKLKSFDKGKGICSDILNDIWCLKLYPNGSWKGKDGDVRIGLHLCGLPPNVSKMSVQFTVYCHEANIEQTKTKGFDEENIGWNWNMNTISFAEFVEYNTWTVTVSVNVLNEFDMNGEDMTMKRIENEWNQSKPQNDAVIPYPDTDFKEKIQSNEVAIESLSTNVQQVQNTLRSLSKAMEDQNNKMEQISQTMSTLSNEMQQIKLEEAKEDRNTLEIIMKRMSVLEQNVNELLSAKSQPKQKVNPKHEKVRNWLKNEVDLEQYYAVFIENGFEDLESMESLNMEILNMMQIEKIGHKMNILRCVAKLSHTQK